MQTNQLLLALGDFKNKSKENNEAFEIALVLYKTMTTIPFDKIHKHINNKKVTYCYTLMSCLSNALMAIL